MRPRERRETGEQDLFRSRLDQIIDMTHALVKLARAINWRVLEERFGSVYTDGPGSPPLRTRLMAGIAIHKYMHDLSDEAVCDHWVENRIFQFFCGEEFFQHRLAFDRSSLTRWRQRMGEEKLQALLQESLAVATRTEAMKPVRPCPRSLDTTVQPKAVTDLGRRAEGGAAQELTSLKALLHHSQRPVPGARFFARSVCPPHDGLRRVNASLSPARCD
jgi:IS5 family transposase